MSEGYYKLNVTWLAQFRAQGLNKLSPTRPGTLKNSAEIWQKVIIFKHLSFCQMSAKFSVSIKSPKATQSACESSKSEPRGSKLELKDL